MKRLKCMPWFGATALLAVFGTYSDVARGGGFQLFEQSVKGLGNAYAGSAASAEDAATVFFNPAGMIRLPGTQVQGAAHVIATRADFTNQGSTTNNGQPLLGPEADGGIVAAVWNGYITHALGDRIALGFGVNSPFGLETAYASGWVGRYHAIESELQTINLSPSIALSLNEVFSIGLGIDVQYIDVKLSNAIDFGTLLAPTGLTSPQANDGFQELKASDWGVGYNLGILFFPEGTTRLGVAFRSRIDYDLVGKARFDKTTTIDAALAAVGRASLFQDTGVKADATLPETMSAGLYHRLTPTWAVLAGFAWTHWNTLQDSILIRFENTAQPDQMLVLNYQDTFRYSLGLDYYPNNNLTLRAGIAYDETPIPNAESRSARLPDNDRLWLALGLSYYVKERFSLDIGYAHLFVDDANIRSPLPTENPRLQSILVGKFENSVDIVSAQVSWFF